MKEGWTYKKLGEVADVVHGKNQKEVLSENGQYPIYGSGGNIMGYANSYLCEAGTTILGRKGSINNPLFIEERFWNVDTAFGIYAKKGNDSKYIYYFIKSIDWSEKNTGTTLPSLTQQVVKSVELPIPNFSEQKRIVSRLDAAYSHIDELKANAEKQLSEARALFQKSLAKALEPKEDWKFYHLQDICTDVVDCPHTTPRKVDKPTIYPCIRTSELRGGQIDWKTMQYLDEEEYKKRTTRIIPKENDIVYGREGTYGDAALLPKGYCFSLGQRTMLLRPNVDLVYPEFLLNMLISTHVYEQAKAKNSGCGVGHVNVKDIKVFKIYIPPLSEQQRIVERLDALSAHVRELEENQKKIISECDALKQALLRKVFE